MIDNKDIIIKLAKKYNNPLYFENDPVIFGRFFFKKYNKREATLQDVEIASLLCSHLAWGKRDLIVRDCTRLLNHMDWKPYDYIRRGLYRQDDVSIHRTIKWSDIAKICYNLKEYYHNNNSLEKLSVDDIREKIIGSKRDLNASNKKIHMFRRWMVRNDNIIDYGIWKNIKPADLIIPLDIHVHRSSIELKITSRKSVNLITAIEITNFLKSIFPNDPLLGDFSLFAYAAHIGKKNVNFEKEFLNL